MSDQELIKELHERAMREGKPTYTDPKSGYEVFTREHHLKRGYCCTSGCRHCPYGELREKK